MNNIERENLIKQKLKTGQWKIKTRKTGFDVLSSSGTVIASAPIRHDALKLAAAKESNHDY